jgi:hypothetical protein
MHLPGRSLRNLPIIDTEKSNTEKSISITFTYLYLPCSKLSFAFHISFVMSFIILQSVYLLLQKIQYTLFEQGSER